MLGITVGVYASGSAADTTGISEEARCWTTGLCELFPCTTSVTMKGGGVKDEHLTVLASKCPKLAHANFTACQNLTDEAVRLWHHLTHANFGWCHNLTDTAVIALASHCRELTHVDFSKCGKLTDRAVLALAENCPGITHARFRSCRRLTDAAVLALAERCPNIEYADFSSCSCITLSAAIERLAPALGGAAGNNPTDRDVGVLDGAAAGPAIGLPPAPPIVASTPAVDKVLSLKSIVKSMRPAELKSKLKELGLPTQGPKKDLQARLLVALANGNDGVAE